MFQYIFEKTGYYYVSISTNNNSILLLVIRFLQLRICSSSHRIFIFDVWIYVGTGLSNLGEECDNGHLSDVSIVLLTLLIVLGGIYKTL